MEAIERIPFFRLLLPLLLGIAIQYYYPRFYGWMLYLLIVGLIIVLLSFFLKKNIQYKWRHLFGIGISFILISVGIVSTILRQEQSLFLFKDINEVYEGTVTDIPKQKPQTIAIPVTLSETNKNIVCYIPQSKDATNLKVGDKISFFGKIVPFKNRSDDFDYRSYMKNQGYSGMIFIKSDQWEVTGKSHGSFYVLTSFFRQKIIDLYQSLGLSDNELGLLCALTVGYKGFVSEDIISSFRATGTAHVLAISGMHILIIYSILSFLVGVLLNRVGKLKTKNLLVILFLWIYVSVIGFPPSAVRACIMLSILCLAIVLNYKTYSLNSLFGCAFLMLVWNPLWLFDIGFQLSFAAVLSMMIILPQISEFTYNKPKVIKYFLDIFVVSVVVQIGTLPLCLYYFGTFPLYFFIANLFVIPLVTLLVYVSMITLIVSLPAILIPGISTALYYIPLKAISFLTVCLVKITSFFENLPYAVFDDLKIGLVSILLLWILFYSLILFARKGKSLFLITSLSSLLILMLSGLYELHSNKNSLIVNQTTSKVIYYVGYNKKEINSDTKNQLISLCGKTYFILNEDKWKCVDSQNLKKDIDYLHISSCEPISLISLSRIFNIKKVILDSSLPVFHTKRLILECEKLRIPYHDISNDGTIRIFF